MGEIKDVEFPKCVKQQNEDEKKIQCMYRIYFNKILTITDVIRIGYPFKYNGILCIKKET